MKCATVTVSAYTLFVLTHEEDIAEFADDILREEVEFERVDDDVFISVEDEVPLPFINTLQFKKNDELSGNRPYYDFVSNFLMSDCKIYV